MTAVLEAAQRQSARPSASSLQPRRWIKRSAWRRFTPLQLVVMALAAIPPGVIVSAILSFLTGAMSADEAMQLALAAGENPGMLVFGAMFLASPVQWLTGRSQVRVRKYLGIVFFLLALSNGVVFALESGFVAALGAPFLVAGLVAFVVAVPLFLTSSRWSQRTLGMRRWRLLHKATYLVALCLMAHVLLIPDIGPGFLMIAAGFVARIPNVRRRLTSR